MNVASRKQLFFHPRKGATWVKDGFCWPAFFFGSMWAFARRLYLVFAAMFVMDAGLWVVEGFAVAHRLSGLALIGLLVTLGYAIVRGRYGNAWVRRVLLARGYVPRSTEDVQAT